jgi:hypothetical protein
MRRTASRLLGTLFFLGFAATAQATQYPPPGDPNPADTLVKVSFIQNPAAVPHPVLPDTVWGVGGIITGFDPIATGFAFYIQNRQFGANSAPWTGVDVFTGGSNYQPAFTPALALGDSVFCYGRMDEFAGGTELRGFASSAFANPLVIVRRVSQGNSLPPFHNGTVNELNMLPVNPNAEQWEGCLVKVTANLRVARHTGLGIVALPGANYIAVNNTLCPPASPGPCDSLFIDTATLAGVNAPSTGTIVNSIQGIYDQRAIGYEIQIRDLQDVVDTQPPNVSDAYPVEDNVIRVEFDRNVTPASAQNTANYTLGSLGLVSAAVAVTPSVVQLTINNGLSDGDAESVTINNIVSASNAVAMTVAQTKNFVNGVLSIAYLQGPNPDSLASVPCKDYMRHLGTDNGLSTRLTVRGVGIENFAGTYWIEDAVGGNRSGIAVFAPVGPLTTAHLWTVAGSPQEFFTESEVVGSSFVRDDGAAAVPAPILQTVHALADTVCDPTNTLTTGEDFEGTLVRVQCVQVERTGLAGENFRVTGPYPTFQDTILVDNNVVRTYVPVKGTMINVNGILDLSFGSFRIQPRGDSDITPCTATGVETPLQDVSFSIYPNPSARGRVQFSLPKGGRVELAVYDLLGRKLATLAKGNLSAGQYTRQWNGKLDDGSTAGSGVYFYRLKVDEQVYKLRAVKLD